MLDLCKLLGVEEEQNFRVNDTYADGIYRIKNNKVQFYDVWAKDFSDSSLSFNEIAGKEIIIVKKYKLTKNTYTLLSMLKFDWIAKDENGDVYVFPYRPDKKDSIWDGCSDIYFSNHAYKNLDFSFLHWEDKEPTIISYILNNCEIIEDDK